MKLRFITIINHQILVQCDHCKNHFVTKSIEYDIKVPLQVGSYHEVYHVPKVGVIL